MKESVTVCGGTYKTREVALVVVASAAVAMCVLFLGLYAGKTNGSSGGVNQGVTSAFHGQTPKPASVCKTADCLETVVYVNSLINKSADPCEDFYSYACGSWSMKNPLSPSDYHNDVFTKMMLRNEQRIRRILESPKTRYVPWGSERKVKDLYTSCLNEYGRMAAGGNSFVEKVLKVVGGWYVLGNFNPSNWDLLANIEKVHINFWTDVLFAVRVETDWDHPQRKVISLQSAKTGMNRWYYSSTYSFANKTRQAYMDFMKTVAGLLVRDSKVSMTDTDKTNRINVFVSDVMNVETMLANISSFTSYDYDSTQREKLVRINNLTALTSTTFNWISFFQNMFDTAWVNDFSFVAIPEKDYIQKMAIAINNMGANKNRMLNNYFTWTMALKYIPHMSSEYIHASRTYRNSMYGYTEFSPTWEECFNYVASTMKDALSHLYVKDHFSDRNKKKVQEVADYVRKALVDSLTGQNFMDDATRQYAKRKIQFIMDKIGYPEYVLKNDDVDKVYASLEIHPTDYFQNVLNMNKFNKVDLNNQVKWYWADPEKWDYHAAYDTWHAYLAHLNEIVIPSGLLQNPIYDYRFSNFLSFGSVGTIIAGTYFAAIDSFGSLFDRFGRMVESTVDPIYTGWWSNTTLYNYRAIRKCLMDFTVNKTDGSQTGPFYQPPFAVRWKGNALAKEVMDVKLASKAYKAWVAKNGAEPMPPIIGLTNQQMYFVAYAQTKCYSTLDWYGQYYYYYGFEDSFKVNMAVAQVQEFADAFKCSAKAKLNAPKKCPMQ